MLLAAIIVAIAAKWPWVGARGGFLYSTPTGTLCSVAESDLWNAIYRGPGGGAYFYVGDLPSGTHPAQGVTLQNVQIRYLDLIDPKESDDLVFVS